MVAVVVAALAVLGTYIVVERLTREPPNYTQIEDGLWLGGYVPEPPDGTTAVLNLCESEDRYHVVAHRWVPIRDAAPAPSLEWLREQVAFVDAERRAGRVVYIHCHAGVSRSAMVLTAYLMKREGWNRDRALEYLRTRRPIVRPNPIFMELLREWERESLPTSALGVRQNVIAARTIAG